MAFLAPLVPLLGAVSAGFGIYNAVQSMKQDEGSAPAPTPEPVPEAPTPQAAEVDAAEEVKKRRKMSALSGGITDLTRGKALVPEQNVGRKSLLGA